jgi:tRNA-dihydrouridine synthase B
MAEAAQYNANNGAQIIDINMGCPAKKVCNVMAGSALLQDEDLVKRILDEVVNAVDVPVTLKIRTGWNKEQRNAINIAKIAEQAGIQALSIHGRTRACAYKGEAEYDTIAAVKAAVNHIPVIANGDIRSPEKAKFVLEYTKADGIMIGRAAQGKPWIFREIWHYLQTDEILPEPSVFEVRDILLKHMENLYQFYGEHTGVRMARKHLSWYSKGQPHAALFRNTINRVDSTSEQMRLTHEFFEQIAA